MQSTKKMLRFERQQKSLLMEMKEMKSMINEMKYYMGGSNDDDVLEVHQNIMALNKTTEELESMGQVLVSKQHQASDELNLALKKLTQIAMKYSSSTTSTTNTEQNRAFENAKMVAEDEKTEAEKLRRRVLELEMELELEQLTVDVIKNMGCEENVELKKEVEELKTKLNEKELELDKANETLFLNVTEKLQSRVNELEKQVEDKKVLELENEQLKKTLNEIKNMGCDGGGGGEKSELQKKIDEVNGKLRENEELLESKEAMNKILNEKELSMSEELQEARKELILGLKGMSSSLIIGVKTTGELDLKPFLDASSKLKCPAEEAFTTSIKLCWSWRELIKDPNWHPFKIVKAGYKNQEVIDEQDERLKCLKEELGEEVFKAVTMAVIEMNEYNPRGSG